MSRSLAGRVLSLALSLWVSLFLGESEWVVRCPAHAGGLPAAAQTSSSSDHSAHGHQGADHLASQPASADHAGTHGSGSHNCSCPGPGCCPPALAMLPGALPPLSYVVAVHEAAAVSTLERYEAERDHVLPFATAPPTAALAPAAA